jgi:hypothetical protein
MAKATSIQDRSSPVEWEEAPGSTYIPVVYWAPASPTDVLPPWWSFRRDVELRRYWKKDGLLASSIYTMQAIVSTTGYTIDGNRPRVTSRARKAIDDAEYGQGFGVFRKKFTEAWLTQDNGVFVEIEGQGNISSPLTSPPVRINTIDPGRCWRSGDPEHPVWYYSEDKHKWYKMHWTRVAFSAPNPSSIELARGIGFCAVSRMEVMSNVMRSIQRYKQEKTGGRHTRGVMYGNVPSKVVAAAFKAAQEEADNAGDVKYSAYPYIANPHPGAEAATLGLLELSSLPDGFDWNDELTTYMYCLALALGIDAREIWPATASGATRADAEVQHRKAMRKGVGDIFETLENIINYRILPDGVTMDFKPKDSEEDQQQADIEKTRADTVEIMLNTGVVTAQGAALWLVDAGVLKQEYLDDPRLSPTAESEEEVVVDEEGEEEIVETDTGDSGNLPVAEDESEPTKAKQIATPDPEIDQRTIRRELTLWNSNPELKAHTVPPDEVGGFDELRPNVAKGWRQRWHRFFRTQAGDKQRR